MLSLTVIVWVQVVVLPQLSAAWYVLVMMRGQLPAHTSLIQVTTGVPQLSVAITRVMSGAGTSVTQATDILAGQVMAGGVLSSTVKFCAQLLTLPQLSAMLYVRVTVLGQSPVAVWLTRVKLPTTSPQLSEAVPPAAVN